MSDFGEHKEQLGYQFRKRMATKFEGYSQLIVNIESQPTRRHFDPETLELYVKSERSSGAGQGVEKIEIYHPWPGENHYQVLLGRIYIKDRLDKIVEAFSFGGDLAVRESASATTCQISSETPIISLADPDPMLALLVAELEVVLAEDRAKVSSQRNHMGDSIVRADPLKIYAASLVSLKERLTTFTHKELPDYQHLGQLVLSEVERLKQEKSWPEPEQDLDALQLD